MRFFISLEIPEDSQKELRSTQDQLKQIIPELKLTDTNKLHLTIAFIGERPDSLREALIDLISHTTQDIPAFTITPSHIDGFPNIHTPKTIFVGVTGDIDKLMVVTERVKDGLIQLGIDVDERRFIPHIALAKSPNNTTRFKEITVSSIKLFESVPSQGFHSHNTLAEIFLSPTN
jgi:RNA 2',3'-cyclic 3'-phosphodiesterase